MFNLAIGYQDGLFCEKNPKKAFDLYEKAANLEDLDGKNRK